MKKALVIVDYTDDFIAEGAPLEAGEPGRSVHDAIVKLTKEFIEEDEFVVFANDMHYPNDPYHPETKLFPPHNLVGTDGRLMYGELQEVYEQAKDKPNVLHRDKTRYSAFAGTDLDILLRARRITELHLVGVCTDICILHTAVDAYNLGYDIYIHKDGVQSFNPAGHEFALEHLKNVINATIV